MDNNKSTGLRHPSASSPYTTTTVSLNVKSEPSSLPLDRAAKLAEFALVDPKRAKRILANRQSAARSKQRKMHYICNLEKRVQSLKAEETSLFTQLTILERDIQTLFAANNELRLKIQTTVQQIHLQRALKDALREEIQQLQVLIGQTMLNGGPMKSFSYGRGHQYYPNNQTMYTLLTEQQFQQLQTRFYKWQQQQVQQQQSQQQFQHPQLLQQQQFQQLMQLQQQQLEEEEDDDDDDDDDDDYDDEP